MLSIVFLSAAVILIFVLDLKMYFVPLFLGWIISFVNVIVGGLVIARAFKHEGTGFINKVLSSLVLRIFAVIGILFVLIYFFKVEKYSLAIIMFFFYIVFLIVEINFISESSVKKKQV